MHFGYLSDHFEGVAMKRLAAVDADRNSSNQHEVTGSKPLLSILGQQDRKISKDGEDNRFEARYVWLGGEQDALSEDGWLSWYDSRRNDPKRSAEWRLYYQSNAVTDIMSPGDTLFLARRANDSLLFIVTPPGSTTEQQLSWLFGLPDQPDLNFSIRELDSGGTNELDFAAQYILDELGIEISDREPGILDSIIDKYFGPLPILNFPTTREMSDVARRSLAGISVQDDPDGALLAWIAREEQLFRRLETHIVSKRLQYGFLLDGIADVDGFLAFSLSVQNRRKSRMGYALEHHFEAILQYHQISHARGAVTEGRSKPDFIFPGIDQYADPEFASDRLTMLGAKSSCKDRWRQVLAEAKRIQIKHLLTLEPSISEMQTSEMQMHNLQLVMPLELHKTYKPNQRNWLMSVRKFIEIVRNRQLN